MQVSEEESGVKSLKFKPKYEFLLEYERKQSLNLLAYEFTFIWKAIKIPSPFICFRLAYPKRFLFRTANKIINSIGCQVRPSI